MCLTTHASFPGCVVELRPLSLLRMMDGAATGDKTVAVPTRDPRYEPIDAIDHVSPQVLRGVRHFFSIYKELESEAMVMEGWHSLADARQVVSAGRQRYLDSGITT